MSWRTLEYLDGSESFVLVATEHDLRVFVAKHHFRFPKHIGALVMNFDARKRNILVQSHVCEGRWSECVACGRGLRKEASGLGGLH